MGLASRGLRETEAGGHEKVDEAAIADASRRTARTIYRDGILLGVAGALLAAATALVR